MHNATDSTPEGIAIIGMAGKFPGADNIQEFWNNLISGTETITFFKDSELLENGVSLPELQNPYYVKAKGVLKDAACFDAASASSPTRICRCPYAVSPSPGPVTVTSIGSRTTAFFGTSISVADANDE